MEQRRRLSDRILAAHAQACEEGKIDVAEALLRALEVDASGVGGRPGADRRRSTETLEAAYRRHEAAKAASAR